MEKINREERRRIFRNELFNLKEEGYLSENIVRTVAKAHHQYHIDLAEIEVPSVPSEKPKPIETSTVSVKPKRVKKTLTPEEVRERNITWSLNIGVIFLLIGGLFVATSNWESMTSLMKSGSIAVVALLFYGLALLTKRVLKIEKTAFAFIVLGSLFLPIFILSLGWFGLLGVYLSIKGEDRYIVGMLGSFLPIIVYILFAKNLASRLFVWFTYISLSAGVAFLLAAFNLSIDLFYLGMMAFNAALILVYHQVKHRELLQLFTRELVLYVQANLVLSTLFMLFFYDNEVLYSFNLLLTALIYLSMIYVSGKKEYHFIFTTMLVYGAYQLIEHSFLNEIGAIVYALIGFGLVFVPKALDDKFSLDKVFQYTSAAISGFAFIYISLDGILLRAGHPSVILLLAYFIIACNFFYLSKNSSRWLFPYLSSVFVASAIYEAIILIMKPFEWMNFSLSVFMTGFTLFCLFGIVSITKHLTIIQKSSTDVGIAVMALSILWSMAFSMWWELGFMFVMISIVSYLLQKREKRHILKEISLYLLPSSLGLSMVAFGEEINSNNPIYFEQLGYAINFAAGAIIVLLSSFAWRKISEKELERISFFLSELFYTLAIVHALLSPINQTWVQPIVLLVGIAMYVYLYKKISTKWVPYLISITTLLSYFSICHALFLRLSLGRTTNSLLVTTSAVMLLLLAYICRRKGLSYISDAFAWVGQCLYPLVLGYIWFAYHKESFLSFVIALIVYALSTKIVVTEWKLKVYLYGSFTALYFVVSTGIDYFALHYVDSYDFPITSCLVLLISFICNQEFKKRTVFYLVPFSLIGIISILIVYPFNLVPYLVTCSYSLVLLFYLHMRKWDLLGIIPLFVTFVATVEFSYMMELKEISALLLSGGLGILMFIVGQVVYKKLFDSGTKLQETKIDGYTFVSFLYFWFMYFFINQQLWSSALPGILIAGNLWMQKKRVPTNFSVFMPIIAGVYLLQPYYSIIDKLKIDPLWEREVQVLPLIVLVIFMQILLKGQYKNITKAIEWAVLVLVALLLIQDGLASNTIYDAIIIGSLSLLSMVAGIFIQIKSYFFIGSGVLLLNVFLQTRPYWGNAPWWVYLLITGLVLITIASFNEWHKQKTLKGESTFIAVLKEKVINRIKQWN